MKPKEKGRFAVFLTEGSCEGSKTWHYVKVMRLKVPLFQKALRSGVIDVADFGDVLFSGRGESPPDSVRRLIDRKYA